MSHIESDGRDYALSYLPSWYLVHRRMVWPMRHKLAARLGAEFEEGSRRAALLTRKNWLPIGSVNPMDADLDAYEKEKYIGELTVCGRDPAYFAAHDPQDPAQRIRLNKRDATIVHVNGLKGAQDAREHLAATADYIETHEPLRNTKYVAGLTYPAMGRLATAFGFRQMELDYCEEGRRLDALAFHLAYCAINQVEPKGVQDFKPTVVYMPTDEYVQRFSTARDAAHA